MLSSVTLKDSWRRTRKKTTQRPWAQPTCCVWVRARSCVWARKECFRSFSSHTSEVFSRITPGLMFVQISSGFLDLERKPALDKRVSGSTVTAQLWGIFQVLGNLFHVVMFRIWIINWRWSFFTFCQSGRHKEPERFVYSYQNGLDSKWTLIFFMFLTKLSYDMWNTHIWKLNAKKLPVELYIYF